LTPTHQDDFGEGSDLQIHPGDGLRRHDHAMLGTHTHVGRSCHKELRGTLDCLGQTCPLLGLLPPAANTRLVHEVP
jgi:hypothetical protein